MERVRFLLQLVFLLFLLLTVSCRQLDGRTLDPVRAYPSARTEHFMGFQGELCSDTMVPFIAKPVNFDFESGVVRFTGGETGGLLFLLFRPQEVEVELEGQLAKAGRGNISFEVNGQKLESNELTSEWKKLKFTIPASLCRVGRNEVLFTCDQDSTWRYGSFTSPEPRPALGVSEEAARLSIPFGAALDYPLKDSESTSVSLMLEPWSSPGAPQLEEGSWNLKLTLTSDEGVVLKEWDIKKPGHHLLDLPERSGFHILTVSLEGGQVLPGQLGVTLLGEPPPEKGPAPPLELGSLSSGQAGRPNVYLFVVDTLRADYLEPYGAATGSTPHFQEFAEDAVLYANCTAPTPWTKPSVATLVTGLSPAQHQVLDFGDKLSEQHLTLAEVLSQAGYRSQAVVNNGLLDPRFGYGQGYGTYRMVDPATTGSALVRFALDKVETEGKEPQFLHLHLLDPHTPYRPPGDLREKAFKLFDLDVAPGTWGSEGLDDVEVRRYTETLGTTDPSIARQANIIRALYTGEIAEADRAFGLFIDDLKQKGLYRDALIVVVSDHGEEMLDHGSVGHLTSLYQELIHVPLMVKLPGNERAGSVVNELCELANVTPTILQTAVGVVPLPGAAVTLDKRTTEPFQPVFLSADVGRDALRLGQGERNYLVHSEGVRLGDWIWARYLSSTRRLGPLSLFNLEVDPDQKDDVLWKHPALALYLESLVKQNRTVKNDTHLPPEEAEELRKTLESLQYLR